MCTSDCDIKDVAVSRCPNPWHPMPAIGYGVSMPSYRVSTSLSPMQCMHVQGICQAMTQQPESACNRVMCQISQSGLFFLLQADIHARHIMRCINMLAQWRRWNNLLHCRTHSGNLLALVFCSVSPDVVNSLPCSRCPVFDPCPARYPISYSFDTLCCPLPEQPATSPSTTSFNPTPNQAPSP